MARHVLEALVLDQPPFVEALKLAIRTSVSVLSFMAALDGS